MGAGERKCKWRCVELCCGGGEVWGSGLRCGVGEERSGERCKGGFRGCGKVWKEMRGEVRCKER